MSLLTGRNVQADVAKALKQKQSYIGDLTEKYAARKKERQVPVIAFCGMGRAGKDLGAEWLGTNYCVQYGGSLSQIVCPLVAVSLDLSEEECFAQRHQDRDYWYRWCNHLRAQDPTLLARMLLAQADIVVGIRAAIELEACVAEGVIDLSLWVDNPRVDPDPTVEYGPADCQLTVVNAGTKVLYFDKLRALAETIRFRKRSA